MRLSRSEGPVTSGRGSRESKADASEFIRHETCRFSDFPKSASELAALSETSASIRVIGVPVWQFLFRRLRAAFPELPDEMYSGTGNQQTNQPRLRRIAVAP